VLFHTYYKEWIDLYKRGAIHPATLQKYEMTLSWISTLAPGLLMSDLDKRSYQNILNEYAKTHEVVTTRDFHRQLKSAILDAVDEGLLKADPSRKAVIKGKPPTKKKLKFLSQAQLQSLLESLDLADIPNWDWFILLAAKTGLRFAEALALTPDDFDFEHQKLRVDKTWDYKRDGGFTKTKNESSKRAISIDSELCQQFSGLLINCTNSNPIFVDGRVFNSTINNRLKALCKLSGVPVISFHGLRHTHASLLIYAGVSIASIAKRLGHSNTTTTQETYLHIIKELEDQDTAKILTHLSTLTGKGKGNSDEKNIEVCA